jgi:putative heme iron utilization protein
MWRGAYNRTEWIAMNSTEKRHVGSTIAEVRRLVAGARTATLASLMEGSGDPYASLVNVASHEGTPVMLLSQLAWHTRNIVRDSRACLLILGSLPAADALAGPRVSLIGRLRADNDERLRESYLALHPNARSYADFADFTYFRLNVETAHYVAGFGQIITIEKPQLHSQAVECH